MALQPIPTTLFSIMGRSLLVACAALSVLGVARESAIASSRSQADALRGFSQMPVRVMKLCHSICPSLIALGRSTQFHSAE
ncbi:hypothetical protein HNI00_13895 [Thermoleptolyngbya oregonensis NK1-22]|uniref:Uncharacterized protein n=1 Tax=Thermoleptolyngbya oregonensis NK1-22 TaxID=2547457 RepID=A0AA96YAI6_9CYAN|nr:hypothetical protein [Thermoleptolyngbya oregonensis]WOB44123.1 hypothetical protein HNI00_13895 [Thermoleptolyngbya oregonensis NK1-22]